MAAGATYEPIGTTTLTGSTSTTTFTSIPATYTDLRLVFVGSSDAQGIRVQFNGDTATNYSYTLLRGNGTSATSSTSATLDGIILGSFTATYPNMHTFDVFSYAGSTYKTGLITAAEDLNGGGNVRASVGLWRSTSAITSLRVYGFSGSNITGTATLYGIKSA
jgi:hypothetical protein